MLFVSQDAVLDMIADSDPDSSCREICRLYSDVLDMSAVEVVRCKECIHFDGECCDRYADETLGYSHSTQPNFFCACGERKTDG